MSKNIEPTPCAVCGGEAGEGRTWCEPCVDKWVGDAILLEVNIEKGIEHGRHDRQ